jgi:hypothetical protein
MRTLAGNHYVLMRGRWEFFAGISCNWINQKGFAAQ